MSTNWSWRKPLTWPMTWRVLAGLFGAVYLPLGYVIYGWGADARPQRLRRAAGQRGARAVAAGPPGHVGRHRVQPCGAGLPAAGQVGLRQHDLGRDRVARRNEKFFSNL
jgi:hypothetical protein